MFAFYKRNLLLTILQNTEKMFRFPTASGSDLALLEVTNTKISQVSF